MKLLLKKSVNMFERMEIAEYIYEGVVEPSYKKHTREDDNCADHSRKMRGESASSTTNYKMSESSGNRIKRYVDHPKDISKLSCLIHVPRHSSDECNILGDFVSGLPRTAAILLHVRRSLIDRKITML